MKLAGEVAIVTGAGRGIGRALAMAQAAEGAKVALLARTAAEIETTAETIRAAGGTARAYAVDLIRLDAVDEVIAAVERELGPVGLAHQQCRCCSAPSDRSGWSSPTIGGTTSRPISAAPSTAVARCCRA